MTDTAFGIAAGNVEVSERNIGWTAGGTQVAQPTSLAFQDADSIDKLGNFGRTDARVGAVDGSKAPRAAVIHNGLLNITHVVLRDRADLGSGRVPILNPIHDADLIMPSFRMNRLRVQWR